MASRSFPRYVEEELGKIPHFVIFAMLEWVLIVILFLDGLLAFAANEFAKFFELKIPCWLCTRIDHVLVHRNPDFYYNDSICESHKKDVSCLAFCHNHRKLSDIKKMCESCLLSFATEKESDCDTYKSLVGILHKDLECFVEDDQQIQLSLRDDDGGGINGGGGGGGGGVHLEKSSTQKCSCCGKPLRVKSSYPPKGKSFSQAHAPSPRAHPYSASSRHEEYSRREMKVVSDSEGTEDVDGIHGGGGGGAGSQNHHQDTKLKEEAKVASTTEGEDLHDESNKTPSTTRANRFFGIPFTDGANYNPRWSFKLNRKSPLEKTEFAGDSHEGHAPFEAEDAILNHLKRHVRLDRKSLMALYMELDEERSASAVAANNAMAMITRLQAEKAAVQMEALQYQRMMEEQAEYDEEALQAASEMLIRREDEIKALETELAIYREKYGCLVEEDFKDLMSNEDSQEFRFQPYLSHHHGSGISSPPNFINEGDDNGEKGLKFHQSVSSQVDSGGGRTSESLRDPKGEKAYLLSRIKKLDTRNHMADNGFQFPQCSTDIVNNVENGTDKASEAASITSLTDIVKALEVDSGFLELVCKEHEEHTEETEILTAISENLEKLRHLVMNSPKASPKASPKTSPKGDTA
ncbi:putative myosin-binding protein 5 [Senna tora]|uniref:Putative myosin-binding protein 5 n=1 Tax=Senna tora TaxID=362788 RepID=A0A835CGW3_9FABA|nr:putative myosin-binding protein 5 [Senna tora]